MIALRIFLAIYGVFLAVFLQAYGLPIFLASTILLGWWIERGKPIVPKTNNGWYIIHLLYLWAILMLGMIFFRFAPPFIQNVMEQWNTISLLQFEADELDYEFGIYNKFPTNLMINIAAFIIPIIVSLNFSKLISSFPSQDYLLRRVLLALGLIVMTFISVWGFLNWSSPVSSVNLNAFNFYIWQSLILIFLFSNFKMDIKR